MNWPDINFMKTQAPLPDGYRYQRLRRIDIPILIQSITDWYPDVSVGAASCYLQPDFYENKATLEGEVDRDLLVIMTWKGDDFAGFVSWDWETDSQALYARFGVVSPAHRSAKLATIWMQLGETIGRHLGAGFIYTLCTLKVPHMQMALERAGFKLLGFAPGYDREFVAPGVIKRVFEAYYAKILVTESELQRPDLNNLTPKTRELFLSLFPN